MMKVAHDHPRSKNTAVSAAPVASVCVTQDSAPLVLGMSSRRFREFVLRHHVKHVRDGKLVIVLLTDWTAAFERLAAAEQPTPDNDAQNAPRSADEMLAELGYQRGGGR